MSIFDNTDFAGSTIDVPVGQTTITDNGNISIIKSDGVNQTVFNSLSTALKCLNFMNSRGQYYMEAGDDLTILNLQTKLLIVENTFINQKLMNSYVLTYHGNSVKAIHRNLSNLFNLTDALKSVGFKVESTNFNTNLDLQTNLADEDRPRVAIVDWYYFVTTHITKLTDTTQIVLQ